MACSYISSSTVNNGTRTNTTITAPASIADNDILRIFFRIAAEPGPPATPTPPSGFSQLLASTTQTGLGGTATGEQKIYVWEKRASSESGDYTVTHSSNDTFAYMEVVRGAVTSGSAEDFAVTQNAQTNNSTYTATGGTTTVTGSFVTFFSGGWNGIGATPPPGNTPTFTERYDTTEGYAANGVKIPSGATGNKSASGSSQGATGGSITVLASVKAIAPTAAVTGTATASITEADIVSGGKTVIVTLTNDTFVPDTIVTPTLGTDEGTESGNNTAEATWAVAYPDASAGDLLIFCISWDDSTTTTDVSEPAGPNSEVLSEVNATPAVASNTACRCKVWYTIATGSWSASTLTFTPSATEQWTAAVVVIPAGEFDADDPIGASTTAASAGVTDTNVLSAAFTAGSTDGDGRLFCWTAANQDPQTLAADWTQIANQDRGIVSGGLFQRDAEVSDSESIASDTVSTIAGDDWCSVSFIVRASTTTPFEDARQAFINGMDSAQSEGTGWDAEVKAKLAVTTVVRTSDTVVTVTLSAQAGYNITAQETITVTVPATILTGQEAVVASPTFTVDATASGGGALSAQGTGSLTMAGASTASGAFAITGTAEVQFSGAAIADAALNAQGEGTLQMNGTPIVSAAMDSKGSGAAQWDGAASAEAAMDSQGVGAAQWAGAAIADGALNAQGEASALWAGASTAASSLAADGAGAAQWVGGSIADGAGDFLMAGSSSVQWVGASTASSELSIEGVGAAAFVGATEEVEEEEPEPTPRVPTDGGVWGGRNSRQRRQIKREDEELVALIRAIAPDLMQHKRKVH